MDGCQRKRLLLVFGTRPETIKMAPLIKQLSQFPEQLEIKCCVTAQHRQMLDQMMTLFSIKPDFDLDVMVQDQDLTSLTSTILLRVKEVLNHYPPDLVLVQGDTTTALATTLAAFYQKIPVGHIEAGLRTNNLQSPWPEEANRALIARMATYHFAVTELNKENLLNENISSNIFVTGNTVIDALLWTNKKIDQDHTLQKNTASQLALKGYPITNNIFCEKRRLILITGHRRENWGSGFANICHAIHELAIQYPDVDFVYPIHLNPNVKNDVVRMLQGIRNVYLIPPLDYIEFIYLMKQSFLVMTDSGGIQEETPSLNKPVLVLRNTTERSEGIEAGVSMLVGTDSKRIVQAVKKLFVDAQLYMRMSQAVNPYGDGKSAQRIAAIIYHALFEKEPAYTIT